MDPMDPIERSERSERRQTEPIPVEAIAAIAVESTKRKRSHTLIQSQTLSQQWREVRKCGTSALQGKCIRCSKVGSQMLFRKPSLEMSLEIAGVHCFDCNASFPSRQGIVRHMEMVHGTLRTQVCYQCYSQEEETCFLCSQAVSRRHDCPVMQFTKHCRCTVCGHLVQDKYAMKRHVQAEHTVGHLATCSTCHKSYPSTSRKGCCKAKGGPVKKIACDQCSLTYQSVQGLRRHQRKKHKVKMALYNEPYAKMCPVLAPTVDM